MSYIMHDELFSVTKIFDRQNFSELSKLNVHEYLVLNRE